MSDIYSNSMGVGGWGVHIFKSMGGGFQKCFPPQFTFRWSYLNSDVLLITSIIIWWFNNGEKYFCFWSFALLILYRYFQLVFTYGMEHAKTATLYFFGHHSNSCFPINMCEIWLESIRAAALFGRVTWPKLAKYYVMKIFTFFSIAILILWKPHERA